LFSCVVFMFLFSWGFSMSRRPSPETLKYPQKKSFSIVLCLVIVDWT
jgi:hypothetical protein